MEPKYKNQIAPHNQGYRAWCFDPRAAAVLNKRLRQYQVAPEMWGDSEGVFTFDKSHLPFVRATLAKLGGLE